MFLNKILTLGEGKTVSPLLKVIKINLGSLQTCAVFTIAQF